MSIERTDKMKSVLIHTVAQFVREEANHNPLITITHVTVTPNYRSVTVFFTTIPDGKEHDALIFLQRKASDLRQYLKSHARLKYIPHINFHVDLGERHRQHIDALAQKIDTEKKGT
jgi:ribosome-binding factor A